MFARGRANVRLMSPSSGRKRSAREHAVNIPTHSSNVFGGNFIFNCDYELDMEGNASPKTSLL
jgi:hypothetical protein